MKYKIGDRVISSYETTKGEQGTIVGIESACYIVKGFSDGTPCSNDEFQNCLVYREELLSSNKSKNEILLTQILNNN